MPELKEEWRDIEGYEGKYQVSNLGRVRSFSNNHNGIKKIPRILKPNYSSWGYLYVNLHMGGISKRRFIHKLVAETFLNNPERKPMVNHKDGCKNNNSFKNLEWVTQEENNKHAFATGLMPPNYNRKLTNEQVKKIRSEYIKGSKEHNIYTIAKKYNVSVDVISQIIRRTTYKNIK